VTINEVRRVWKKMMMVIVWCCIVQETNRHVIGHKTLRNKVMGRISGLRKGKWNCSDSSC